MILLLFVLLCLPTTSWCEEIQAHNSIEIIINNDFLYSDTFINIFSDLPTNTIFFNDQEKILFKCILANICQIKNNDTYIVSLFEIKNPNNYTATIDYEICNNNTPFMSLFILLSMMLIMIFIIYIYIYYHDFNCHRCRNCCDFSEYFLKYCCCFCNYLQRKKDVKLLKNFQEDYETDGGIYDL